LEGNDLDKCKRSADVILERALDECTPLTECEQMVEEAYEVEMKECLSLGGT
jgi:hypothetical protein